mmetsp:Transcript_37299/g.54653  ORF Transcript_37299/g.54653 Transcript_37299/m.54653 type:complete len:87 (-) Transcript_37299:105-365(-)
MWWNTPHLVSSTAIALLRSPEGATPTIIQPQGRERRKKIAKMEGDYEEETLLKEMCCDEDSTWWYVAFVGDEQRRRRRKSRRKSTQ